MAAAAAGVGLLAAAQPAEAKIVYKATSVNIAANAPYKLDLNGDGTTDFTFSFFTLDHTTALQLNLDVFGNQVMPPAGTTGPEAAALPFGAPIGGSQGFTSATSYGGVGMAFAFAYSVTDFWGPWAGATNHYLGLKFLIKGNVHYGWARLSVSDWRSHNGLILLSGYAYETQVNKKISAGDIGPEARAAVDSAAPVQTAQPASLGLLARGADGLAVWRRE
jgi:hypothetical protein